MFNRFNSHFGGDLVNARLKKGFSQAAAAEAAGISVREYQRIEKGTSQIKVEPFLRLIFFFDLEIENYRKVVFPDETVSPH